MNEKYKWLYEDTTNLKEKINFRDKIIYRKNGLLHNITGHAYISKENENENKYYLNGELMLENQWLIQNTKYKIQKIKSKI